MRTKGNKLRCNHPLEASIVTEIKIGKICNELTSFASAYNIIDKILASEYKSFYVVWLLFHKKSIRSYSDHQSIEFMWLECHI